MRREAGGAMNQPVWKLWWKHDQAVHGDDVGGRHDGRCTDCAVDDWWLTAINTAPIDATEHWWRLLADIELRRHTCRCWHAHAHVVSRTHTMVILTQWCRSGGGFLTPLKICTRGQSMFWLPTPKCHTLSFKTVVGYYYLFIIKSYTEYNTN